MSKKLEKIIDEIMSKVEMRKIKKDSYEGWDVVYDGNVLSEYLIIARFDNDTDKDYEDRFRYELKYDLIEAYKKDKMKGIKEVLSTRVDA